MKKPRGSENIRPRFAPKEERGSPEGFQLDHVNARYLDLLKGLYLFRLMTTEGMRAYIGTKHPNYRPLSRLYHAGLVERRAIQERSDSFGSPQTIHLLSTAGLDALDLGDADRSRARERVRRRERYAVSSLRHALTLADFHLLLHLGSQARSDAALTAYYADKELVGSKLTVRLGKYNYKQLRLLPDVGTGKPTTRWPDAFFRLASGTTARNYLLEIDLDPSGRTRKRSRLVDRFRVYAQALTEGVLVTPKGRATTPYWKQLRLTKYRDPYTDHLKAPTVNALFVVPTVKQRDALRELAASMRLGAVANRFWFLAAEDYYTEREEGYKLRGVQRTRVLFDYEKSAEKLFAGDLLRGVRNVEGGLLPS